jgi:hypothetical protein
VSSSISIVEALQDIKATMLQMPAPASDPVLIEIREIMRLMLEELKKEKK